MIPAALAAAALFTAPEIPKDKGYAVQEIRGGLYWVTDGAYNTMFLVHESGVIAVDPLPTLGPRYLEAIAQVTKKPITHVVYSHEHTDHIGAARLFPSSATFIAQRETAELLAARKDPRRPVPSIQFVDRYTLEVGGQRLVLEYRGGNHSRGNVFIHAPKQRVLMLVDVVYPGFMPYKNLGIAEDVQGYLDAHRQALSYDFDVLVGGHVNRLGNRRDVEVSAEFAEDLRKVAAEELRALDFPAYVRLHPATDKWDLHNEYEKALVARCTSRLLPRWKDRLADAATYLPDNCWTMIEALIVSLAEPS
ncbi:MAG TPA: MBL fold metallo-hydrolase [Myxococcales bacterium]|nr:MBL fold metallo-hydrolase [Myxococcales bacterium]